MKLKYVEMKYVTIRRIFWFLFTCPTPFTCSHYINSRLLGQIEILSIIYYLLSILWIWHGNHQSFAKKWAYKIYFQIIYFFKRVKSIHFCNSYHFKEKWIDPSFSLVVCFYLFCIDRHKKLTRQMMPSITYDHVESSPPELIF